MSDYGYSSRESINFALALPGVTPSGSAPYGTGYQLKNLVPSMPLDKETISESQDWDGTFEAVHDVVVENSYGTQTLVLEKLTFAQAIVVAEAAIAGGVTPTGSGPHVWAHSTSSNHDLARIFTENSTPYGASASVLTSLQEGYCEKVVIEWKGDAAFLTATLTVRGNAVDKLTGISAFASHGMDTERIKGSWVKLYLDDAHGDIGTNQVDCVMNGFKLTIDNMLGTTFTDCGPQHGRGGRKSMLEINMLLNADVAAEWDDFRSKTKRFLQLKAIAPTSSQYWQWNMAGKYSSFNHGDKNGFKNYTFVMMGVKDSDLGYAGQQTVSMTSLSALGNLLTAS